MFPVTHDPALTELKFVDTYTIHLYMSGDIQAAKAFMRRECFPPNEGLCVSITPTTFIFTGGEENGFVIGFVNYPRFPCQENILFERAKDIATRLLYELHQWSALLITPQKTEWLSIRAVSK